MNNYHFDDFMLYNGEVLYHQNKILNLPPKEIAVLHMLVKNAGQMITKENIIKFVWCSENIADESLTRCIYVLRKSLAETSAKKFIDTVYGKGYRFVMPVAVEETDSSTPVLYEPQNNPKIDKSVVALFPFLMNDKDSSFVIFDYLMGLTDRFTDDNILFFPSAMTAKIDNIINCFNDLKRAGADYFVTGLEVKTASGKIIRIEIINSTDFRTVNRASVVLKNDAAIDMMEIGATFKKIIKNILCVNTSNFQNKISQVSNKKCEISECYSNYSVFQFDEITDRNRLTLNLKGYEIETLCNLAGCYLALAMLGIMDYQKSEDNIYIITERITTIEPNNALAMSMRALLITHSKMRDSESEFHLAMILAPLSSEVYYYYACYLVKKGDIERAAKINTMSISLNPGFFPARVLSVVLKALSDDHKFAIDLASGLLGKNSSCDIIINSLLAVLHFRAGEKEHSLEKIDKIKSYRDKCAFVSSVYNQIVIGRDAGTVVNDLSGVNMMQLDKQSVYWLPEFEGAL